MNVQENREFSSSPILFDRGIELLPGVDAHNHDSDEQHPLSGGSKPTLNSNDSTGFDVTTDIILDFDGGSVQEGEGYDIPLLEFNGFEFAGFTPYLTSNNSPGNANEQILQIVAGVREDFADFNVNVIWDDRGVDSPFFDEKDTVIQIVDNSIRELIDLGPEFDDSFILGIAANVDVPEFTGDSSIQSRRDTGFVFLPPLREFFDIVSVNIGFNLTTADFETRTIIDVISHEVGHTLGLSHTSERDSEGRQIVTNVGNFIDLDSRFSPELLNHDDPEFGVVYSEVDRLNEAVGPASVLPGDTQSGQTLFNETFPSSSFLGIPGNSDVLRSSSEINFLGDRDAYIYGVSEPGEYTIIQSTNDPSLTPVVTFWNPDGEFVSVGNVGTNGVSSTIFNADDDDLFIAYYPVAGSQADRQPSGMLPDPQTGAYDIFVVGGAFENNQIGSPLDDILTGDGKNNFIAGQGGDDLLEGGGGNDKLLGDAGNDTLDGGFGEDTLEGGDGNDLLKGNRDNDLLLGEAGDDRLVGQGGDDTLNGGDGDDKLWGEAGDDLLNGDAGNDRLIGWRGNDTLDGGFGEDTLEGGDGDDLVKGGRNNDLVIGEAGDDRLVGQGGDDTLLGGQGDDRLWGEAGDDVLNGGAGDDFILGWKGDDSISGGSGRDTFVFASEQGTDIIADFTVGEDFIGLKGGLTVADVSVTTVAGDTQIAVGSQTLAIVENQTLSAADIEFVLV